MKKVYILLCLLFNLVSCQQEQKYKIGVVVPLEHQAMNEIVTGLKNQLTIDSLGNVEVIVQNAQNDMNIQRSIIQQFVSQKVDIILPIGTMASQMSLKLAPNIPVITLAADAQLYHKYKKNKADYPVAAIVDELGMAKHIELIKYMYPRLHQLSLIHSASEKVIPEIEEFKVLAQKQQISTQNYMIKDLGELYTVSQSLKGPELIFILKDHLIVSGVSLLLKTAENLNVPLMTSDEGSIVKGGHFALGIQEKEIGIAGAKMIQAYLNGKEFSQLGVESPQEICLFYHSQSAGKSNINLKSLKEFAQLKGYQMLDMSSIELVKSEERQ